MEHIHVKECNDNYPNDTELHQMYEERAEE